MSDAITAPYCKLQKMQIAICRETCCNYKDSYDKSIIFLGFLDG